MTERAHRTRWTGRSAGWLAIFAACTVILLLGLLGWAQNPDPTDAASALASGDGEHPGLAAFPTIDPAAAGQAGAAADAPIFADVPADHWAREYIEALYLAGYVVGCATNPPRYCPDRILDRAESAVFVLRGAYGAIGSPPWPPPPTPSFGDVPPGFWGYGWIESLYRDGLTAGCSLDPLLYCPLQQHTRAEGSVFFLRVKFGSTYEPPAGSGLFVDVPAGAWYADWVEAAYNAGILPACSTSPLRFCPDAPLDRAWAASMMVQAKGGLPLPTPTLPPPSPTPAPAAHFAVGSGYVDVIPHQLIRTAADRVVLFVGRPYASGIWAYWTEAPGLPNSAADFAGTASTVASDVPISVEAAYGGGRFIIVLANLQNGDLVAYPFDTQVGSFGAASVLTRGNPSVTGDYIGSSGVSAMVDQTGALQVAYRAAGDQIAHQAYTIDPGTGAVSPQGPTTRIDADAAANHPVVAIAPDNSLTIAWVSEAGSPARILARTRSSSGAWGSVETASAAPVWHSTSAGVNIDQGPSLLIGPDGTRHLAYIEDYISGGDYGRVHDVTRTGTTWTDSALAIWSHDPVLAIDEVGTILLIGHGHPANAACRRMEDICTASRSSSGSWSTPAIFAAAPSGSSFDSSPTVKWSGNAAGFVRPETVEFAFFSTPYNSPTVYYARLP